MRILVLLTDAYGGHGGIAAYNRDVLEALAGSGSTAVVALPRIASQPAGAVPEGVDFDLSATGGGARYVRALLKHLRRGRFDLVYCAHVNLSPLAWLAAKWAGCHWMLAIYGIEAWAPKSRRLVRMSSSRPDHVVSISDVTLQRFLAFSGVAPAQTSLLPNAVHLEAFGIGQPDQEMARRLDVVGRKVILTFGRLASEERAKGFDEVIGILPRLITQVPQLVYVIAGTGPDRGRLEARVSALGLEEHVRFTGYVAEDEKADLYRLADVFALPSKGEGFGFVLLEAMACGVPVIASKVDGGREAVRDGMLGRIVDPDNPDELAKAILDALSEPQRIPPGLEYFAFPNFAARVRQLVASVAGSAQKLEV
ncbi:MAG TPA: glycosyltransferase family 4 protein [Allosphingosinicella sp.]|nr:glycosyltransferase family 4 protein [Allosphingosinicella sp.]